MRVIIAGGRGFSDYERLRERVLYLLSAQDKVTIVCALTTFIVLWWFALPATLEVVYYYLTSTSQSVHDCKQ